MRAYRRLFCILAVGSIPALGCSEIIGIDPWDPGGGTAANGSGGSSATNTASVGGEGGSGPTTGATTGAGGAATGTAGTGGAFCGDGTVNDAEACDDGNVEIGDGCSATCAVECDDPLTHLSRDNHCYLYEPTDLTWLVAEQACVAWNGHLVSLTDDAEFDMVTHFAELQGLASGRYWIGATDSDGSFGWSNGDPWVYTHWSSSPVEPSNDVGQDCVIMNGSLGYDWFDEACGDTMDGFVCERSPGVPPQ
jgi:cysteine-rich repeat protein